MRLLRLVLCLLVASLVVFAMLVAGLELFYGDRPAPGAGPEAFEVRYLTPEEAALLLGEDASEYRMPRMPAPRPQPETSGAGAPPGRDPD